MVSLQYVLSLRQNVCLAQLDRAFGYGPKGRGFESSNTREECVYARDSVAFTRDVFRWRESL